MRKESKKRQRDRGIYTKKRLKFLAKFDRCESCNMLAPSQVHHVYGRTGENYLNEKTWKALCYMCHARVHGEPAWARKVGLLPKAPCKEVKFT